MKKLLRTLKRKSLSVLARTLTQRFPKTVPIALPTAACAADTCETSPVVINGQIHMCQRCCREDFGTCQVFCL